jgi:U4/U6 small nuclear ribonucleoprotein PRP3
MLKCTGAEASANPTEIENEVKRQTAARIANHEARNAARKLTKEERKEKIKEKLTTEAKVFIFAIFVRFFHVFSSLVRDLSSFFLKFFDLFLCNS